ncbi:MAG: DUF488 domain-containing protein [Methylocystis sp.]
MSCPFFTIGHSTRTLAEFIELLRDFDIDIVIDVRTIPGSHHNPQFNADILAKALAKAKIEYKHLSKLGGLRGRARDVDPSINAFWENRSFHNYADYAMSEAFQAGLRELRALGHKKKCAVMCSEAVWWRCHRRIIADYLIAAGETVFHILDRHSAAPATMTPAARRQSNGLLTYPDNARV